MSKYQHSIGSERAIAIAKTRWWEGKTPRQIAAVALFTEELCCDFHVLHEAVEKSLGRPVFTHEFGSGGFDRICEEFLGLRPAATMDEILALIPADKRIVIVTDEPAP